MSLTSLTLLLEGLKFPLLGLVAPGRPKGAPGRPKISPAGPKLPLVGLLNKHQAVKTYGKVASVQELKIWSQEHSEHTRTLTLCTFPNLLFK